MSCNRLQGPIHIINMALTKKQPIPFQNSVISSHSTDTHTMGIKITFCQYRQSDDSLSQHTVLPESRVCHAHCQLLCLQVRHLTLQMLAHALTTISLQHKQAGQVIINNGISIIMNDNKRCCVLRSKSNQSTAPIHFKFLHKHMLADLFQVGTSHQLGSKVKVLTLCLLQVIGSFFVRVLQVALVRVEHYSLDIR